MLLERYYWLPSPQVGKWSRGGNHSWSGYLKQEMFEMEFLCLIAQPFFKNLISQPLLISLSYCKTTSYFFVLLPNRFLFLSCSVPSSHFLSYCTTTSFLCPIAQPFPTFVLLCNHILFVYVIAQSRLIFFVLLHNHFLFYLISQPRLISSSYCATMS